MLFGRHASRRLGNQDPYPKSSPPKHKTEPWRNAVVELPFPLEHERDWVHTRTQKRNSRGGCTLAPEALRFVEERRVLRCFVPCCVPSNRLLRTRWSLPGGGWDQASGGAYPGASLTALATAWKQQTRAFKTGQAVEQKSRRAKECECQRYTAGGPSGGSGSEVHPLPLAQRTHSAWELQPRRHVARATGGNSRLIRVGG